MSVLYNPFTTIMRNISLRLWCFAETYVRGYCVEKLLDLSCFQSHCTSRVLLHFSCNELCAQDRMFHFPRSSEVQLDTCCNGLFRCCSGRASGSHLGAGRTQDVLGQGTDKLGNLHWAKGTELCAVFAIHVPRRMWQAAPMQPPIHCALYLRKKVTFNLL
jgi:hypothetical protein